MHAGDLKRTQRTALPRESSLTTETEPFQQDRSSLQNRGWSLARTFEDNTKGSMQAAGQVCRAAVIGVFLFSVGGVGTLLGLLLF